MIYQEETFQAVIEDIKPLLEEHNKEVALYQDEIELDPAYHMYEAMYQAGSLDIFTAREEDTLVGYVLTFIHPSLHYQNDVFAVNDMLYVHPDYRHTEVAPTLLTELEKRMKEKGVSMMSFHMKTYKTFEALMDFLGYDKAEFLFTKLIKD